MQIVDENTDGIHQFIDQTCFAIWSTKGAKHEQARIQEFSSEGVQLSKKFCRKKERKRRGEETVGLGCYFPLSVLQKYNKSTFQPFIYIQVYFH